MVTSTIKKGFYRACSNKIFVEMEDLKVKFLQKKLIGKTDSKSYHPRKKTKIALFLSFTLRLSFC